jgi:hypothetical protein
MLDRWLSVLKRPNLSAQGQGRRVLGPGLQGVENCPCPERSRPVEAQENELLRGSKPGLLLVFCRSFASRVDVQLDINMFHMHAHRINAQGQMFGNLLVGRPFGQ